MSFRCRSWLLAALLILSAPATARAQLFFATRPDPPFEVGPLSIRAHVTPDLGPVEVHVLWSLELPASASASGIEQDLYLLWPGEVHGELAGEKPDPALSRYVEGRGFTVIGEGRLPLAAQTLYAVGGAAKPEAVPGGAPFVIFVQDNTTLGLSPPATWIRIPWMPQMVNRTWLMDLTLRMPGLVKPKKGTWLENLFVGDRHQISLTFNEVRDRPLFPMYFAHRERLVRLADAPSELVVNFSHSDRLKIEQVFPPTSIRRLSETLESTEVVSLFLGTGEGIVPQNLSVQFGYFSRLEGIALVVIPLVLLALGPAMGPILGRAVLRAGHALSARVHLGTWSGAPRPRESGVILPRSALGQLVPGRTTAAEALRVCGEASEVREQWTAPNRRSLVYRGRRLLPEARRLVGWFSTVRHWDVEEHEVRIELVDEVVRDVQAQTRRYRLEPHEMGPPGSIS
ncbi:MAG TPA: hypothetical protein VFO18_16360 [Methylomirabilota bacterium]|nr:hypothetical protein [Methylomirabilota bacterium]